MAVGEAISGLFSNPVDVTTGQKILLPETDFTLPGRLPVTCSRFTPATWKPWDCWDGAGG